MASAAGSGGGAGGGAGVIDSSAAAAASAAAGAGGFDTNLYSRQVAVYGEATMQKLTKMNILIIGMKGLGVEAAKNVVLAGPKSVTIFDPNPTQPADLGSNFFLTAEHVAKGTARAAACRDQLAELNPYVAVKVLEEKAITTDVLSQFTAVLCTMGSEKELITWNDFCRSHTPVIPFVAGEVIGAAAWGFSDFGDAWTVNDPDGEPCHSGIVAQIENGTTTAVVVLDGTRHHLAEGCWVVINEVKGMSEINGTSAGSAHRVLSVNRTGFVLDVDSSKFGEYQGGGVFEQVKVPSVQHYRSLSSRISNPLVTNPRVPGGIITPDWGAMDRPLQLHLLFRGLAAFAEAHGGSLPHLHDAKEAAEVVSYAHAWNKKQMAEGKNDMESTDTAGKALPSAHWSMDDAEIQDALLLRLARMARAEMQPLCAFYGGLLAQELVKHTGKYTPLDGWLYMDALTSLPKDELPDSETALNTSKPSRYDHSITFFGRTFVEKLADLNVFLVGAGALGCEYLKAFALMGIATRRGSVTVTDMDRIELSNLNRQFLFRQKHVGKPKSETAGDAAMTINPEMRVIAMENAVGVDTEDVFTDKFWSAKDIMVNALDNVKARLYVDSKCLFHTKPLLESGTLGTKANSQVVMPHKTCAYGDSVDAPEESIPMCTLRHFPHKIEHCIEWARDKFDFCFTSAIADTSQYISDRKAFFKATMAEENLATRRARLTSVEEVVTNASKATLATCIATARKWFNEFFVLSIKQLLHNFPRDHKDSTGNLFWSGTKRAPTALEFDPNDDMHMEFVSGAAHIVAYNFGVKVPKGALSPDSIKAMLKEVKVEPFVPRNVRIKADEKDKTTEGADDDLVVCQATAKKLVGADQAQLAALHVEAAEFEKDDDTNHHIEFINACANLRARNYAIKESTRPRTKVIAGKIIPAIATTTTMLYKVVADKPLEALRDGFVNLAINMVSVVEPKPPKKTVSVKFDPTFRGPLRAIPEGFTSWDKIVIQCADKTVQEVIDDIQEKYKVEVSIISTGRWMMYCPMMFASHRARANKTIKECYEMVSDKPLPADRNYIMVELSVEDEEGTDAVMPPVQLVFA